MFSTARLGSLARFSILILLTLVALLTMRAFVRVGGLRGATTEESAAYAPYSPGAPEAATLMRAARRILAGHEPGDLPTARGAGRRWLMLSLSRPTASALVGEGRGANVGEALARACASLSQRATPGDLAAGRLRLDVLSTWGEAATFDTRGRAQLLGGLDGLYLPAEDLLLLPNEITSRGLVDERGDLQSKRLSRYLAEGTRGRGPLPSNPGRSGAPFHLVRFASFVEGNEGQALELYRGNRLGGTPTAADLLAAARAGGDYLVRHQRADGTFDYLYRSETDSLSKSYNLLRHAGSCYALFELYGATKDSRYLDTGRRGLEFLLTQTREPRPEHRSRKFETIAPRDEEAKLGGAALAILAILQHRRVTGEDRWLDRAQTLARFVLFLQESSGRFESKYFFVAEDAEPFESIYYPGEAILALTRLHDATGDRRWLDAAALSARWLIDVRDAGKRTKDLPHDHWLLIGLSELHPKTGETKFFAQGQRIAEAILGAEHRDAPLPDWNGGFYDPPRSTPTATRSEALVAMHRLARTNGLDTEIYRAALLRFTAFQLRCQITPDNAFFLPRPDLALGGFRSGLVDGEVRIDYVQHNVSSLLGLRGILLGE